MPLTASRWLLLEFILLGGFLHYVWLRMVITLGSSRQDDSQRPSLHFRNFVYVHASLGSHISYSYLSVRSFFYGYLTQPNFNCRLRELFGAGEFRHLQQMMDSHASLGSHISLLFWADRQQFICIADGQPQFRSFLLGRSSIFGHFVLRLLVRIAVFFVRSSTLFSSSTKRAFAGHLDATLF